MKLDWKLLVLVGVVAVAGFLLLFQFAGELPENISLPVLIKKGERAIVLPKATGNIDDVAKAIIREASADATILNDEETDSSLLNMDSQTISDLGKSYIENEFQKNISCFSWLDNDRGFYHVSVNFC